MQSKNIANASLRLLHSPVVGAIAEVKEAYSRPTATNWKQFIKNDVHAYFSPLIGAIAGVKKELRQRD